jgi:hypothetical protein
MKRMRRKFKAMQRDIDGRAVDWRTLYMYVPTYQPPVAACVFVCLKCYDIYPSLLSLNAGRARKQKRREGRSAARRTRRINATRPPRSGTRRRKRGAFLLVRCVSVDACSVRSKRGVCD